MAKGDQVPMDGIPADSPEGKIQILSGQVNEAVARVESLISQLRTARLDERRTRAALHRAVTGGH